MKKLFIIFGGVLYCFSATAQKGNKEVYYGNKAFEKGDFKTAVSEYQKGLKVAPGNTTARINLAIAQSKLSETEKSVANFDEAIKNTKNENLNATLNYDKGVALAKNKKYEDAVKAFENTLRITPEDTEARENLQKALNELKKQQQKQQPKNNKDKKQPPPPPKKNDQQQKQKENQQQQQQKMNKEQAEKLLQALREQEKETQKKLQKKSGVQVPDNGKDW